ncbi:MAG: aminotransferase class I/II-fold pyridoxal phosphate-dependent enzyme [Clostridia bacterium]|nr:aminotransferase class I/II-fold pyridoxal phosphate-dependent enzyme [Clostridia bacterium]
MYNYLIYNALKEHTKADKSFHMPGHKARGDFKTKFTVAPLDVTELSYTDNLLCPSGIIAGAERDLAEIVGAKRGYILTDGCSSGVLSIIFAVRKLGTKIIVPRNSHQSVWNACKLFGLEPVVVQGDYKDGVLLPPAPELIEKLLDNDRTISGLVVTSPDYYGNVAPLKEYSGILKRHNRYLLVDGAHGAHLAFEQSERQYAGLYADLWAESAHKTLPALTQGAAVFANEENLIPELEEGLSIFRTTSPSFPVMASVEYGYKYLKNNLKILEEAKAAVQSFKEKCPFEVYQSEDWAKLAVDCEPFGVSADAVAEILEKKGVYAELSDGKYILFYLSPMNTAADLNKLLSALTAVKSNKKLKKSFVKMPVLPAAERTYSFQYALRQKHALVPLSAAAGMMSAQNAGVAPPCTPVIVAGEIISDEAVKILTKAKNVFGLENGKIRVVAK